PWELTSGGPGSDLYVSRDGGDTWASLKKDTKKTGLPDGPWGKVGAAVAPSSGGRVYALIEAEKGGLYRSDDGGETWQLANGGGVDLSADGGKAWFAPPLPVTQFYHVAADNAVPFHVMGCMQDLGSARGPSHSLKGGIGLGDWHTVGGGEAGYCVPDPSDP